MCGVILQAGCSDREFGETLPATAATLAAARELVADGRGEDLLPRSAIWEGIPITARRYCSLYGKGGEDDMFSSDLTDEEMGGVLGALRPFRSLILMSGDDEVLTLTLTLTLTLPPFPFPSLPRAVHSAPRRQAPPVG